MSLNPDNETIAVSPVADGFRARKFASRLAPIASENRIRSNKKERATTTQCSMRHRADAYTLIGRRSAHGEDRGFERAAHSACRLQALVMVPDGGAV
jgi:hypothetical protein